MEQDRKNHRQSQWKDFFLILRLLPAIVFFVVWLRDGDLTPKSETLFLDSKDVCGEVRRVKRVSRMKSSGPGWRLHFVSEFPFRSVYMNDRAYIKERIPSFHKYLGRNICVEFVRRPPLRGYSFVSQVKLDGFSMLNERSVRQAYFTDNIISNRGFDLISNAALILMCITLPPWRKIIRKLKAIKS
jgi:hypothetical protein